MSNPAPVAIPASPIRPLQDLDPSLAVLFCIADQLIPLFATGSIEVSLARRIAINVLDA